MKNEDKAQELFSLVDNHILADRKGLPILFSRKECVTQCSMPLYAVSEVKLGNRGSPECDGNEKGVPFKGRGRPNLARYGPRD